MFLYNLKNKGYAVLYDDEDVSVVCDKEHVNKAFSILSRECPDAKVQIVSDIPGYDSSKRYHELECSKSNGWYAQSSSSIIIPDFWEWADVYQYLIYSGQMTASDIKLSNPALLILSLFRFDEKHNGNTLCFFGFNVGIVEKHNRIGNL